MNIIPLYLSYIFYFVVYLCIFINISSNAINGASSTTNVSSYLSNSAFCLPRSKYRNRYHPTDLPEHHLPWIWEAIHDPVQNIVEISTLSRVPCQYNHDHWHDLVRLFPDHKHQLGYGLDSNILVPVDLPWAIPGYFHDKYMYCDYFLHGKPVYEIYSRRIRGKPPYSQLGSYQIRCPVPESISWDRIKLRLIPVDDQIVNNSYSKVTIDVPTCRLPAYDPDHKIYNLSICSATNRPNRDHLVEWIEYHRLVGVDHFYLYDTSYDIDHHSRLFTYLQDYIDEGYVTIVAWPFFNCVRHMAKGRFSIYRKYNASSSQFIEFRPPKPITQYGALASCYTRFKHTSKYIAYIDDDEFFAFSSKLVTSKLSSTLSSIDDNSLVTLADTLFNSYPRAPAIRFEPVIFLPCNHTSHIEHRSSNIIQYDDHHIHNHHDIHSDISTTPLPRIGVWSLSKRFLEYECKLIMRTDAVGMFYIHYISLMEANHEKLWKLDHSVTLPLTHLTLLHFKKPALLSDNILEGRWPLQPGAFSRICDTLAQNKRSNKNGNQAYHAQIPGAIASELKKRYTIRMKQQ